MSRFNTGNPIGSADVKDLSDNAKNLDVAVNDTQNSEWDDRLGVSRKTLHGLEQEYKSAILSIGWMPPVPYESGLQINSTSFTVEKDGIVYRPDPSLVPFTTSSWDDNQWRVLQNTADSNLTFNFSSFPLAESAAATLADGSTVYSPNSDGKLSIYTIQSRELVFKDFVADVLSFDSYESLRSYSGPSTVVDISKDKIIGRFVRVSSINVDNGGTIIVDASGRSWKRCYTGPINIGWWSGVVGANDNYAFEQASKIASEQGGNEVVIPPGLYTLDNLLLENISNVIFTGVGATIKGPSGGVRVKSYIECRTSSRITFDGITFDQMKSALPVYTSSDYPLGPLNVPIWSNSSENISIVNCVFKDLYTTSVYFYLGSGLDIRSCKFKSGVQTQNQWCQHIHLQTCQNVSILQCSFVNDEVTGPSFSVGGLFASGVRGLDISSSTFDYCGRDNAGSHRLGAVDLYGDVTDVRMSDNILKNCMATAIRINACKGGMFSRNRISVHPSAEFDGNTIEITGSTIFGENKGNNGVSFYRNEVFDPSSRAAVTVLIASYDWGYPSREVDVSNNNFYGCKNISRVSGPFDGVSISSNRASGGRSAIVLVPGSGLTSDFGTEAESTYRGLRIDSNDLSDTTSDNANAILIAQGNATSALVGDVLITNNIVRATIGSAAAAVVVQLNSNNRPRVNSTVRGNVCRGYGYGFDVKEHGRCDFTSNRFYGANDLLIYELMNIAALSRGNMKNDALAPETPLAL